MKTYWLQFGSGDPRSFTGLAPSFVLWYDSTGATRTPPGITEIYTGSGQYRFQTSPTLPLVFIADGGATLSAANRYVMGGLDPADLIDEVGQTLISMGTTLTAIGTTNIALGTTNVALGTTGVALGTTAIAIGITGQAIGVTTQQYAILNNALGTTSVALGTTSVALGTTAVAIGITGQAIGVTTQQYAILNFALGTTAVAIGTSILSINTSIDARIGTTASSFGSTSVDPGDIFGSVKRLQELLEGNATFTKSSGVWNIYSRGSSTLLRQKTLTNTVTSADKS